MSFKNLTHQLLFLLITTNILISEEIKSTKIVSNIKKTDLAAPNLQAQIINKAEPEPKKVEKLKLINKNFSDLTFEELEHNKMVYLESDADKDVLTKNLERMLSLCKEQHKICNLRLELADLYFNSNKLDKAANCYKEFVKNYPGNDKAEYCSYQEIVSLFNQTLDPDRDQGKTKEALKLSQDFIKKGTDKEYIKKVKEIIRKCNKKLLEAEINIFYFYLRKKNFKATQKRLDYLKKEFFKNPKNKLLTKLEEHIKLAQENKVYEPVDLQAYDKDKQSAPIKPKKPYVERF